MSEVNLAKRLFGFLFIAFLATGMVACTREKPAEPTPATPVAAQVILAPSPTVPIVVPTAVITVTAPVTPTVELPPLAVITPTVMPTATPIAVASIPGTYTVQWGDWLNKIAAQFGVSTQAIIAANPGINPNMIYPGQVLKIPSSSAPAPTNAPGGTTPTPTAAPTGPTTYTVQRGDWIYAIARKFGVSVAALQAANPGVNPNFVFPGQVLNIPASGTSGTTPPGTTPSGSGSTYTVQPGDTLFSIAVRFKTTTYAIQIRNNLANPNFVYPGQVLIIP